MEGLDGKEDPPPDQNVDLYERRISIDKLLERYSTNLVTGLAESQVAVNSERFGPNVVTKPEVEETTMLKVKKNVNWVITRQFLSWLTIFPWIFFVIGLIGYFAAQTRPNDFLSISVHGLVLGIIFAIIGIVTDYRAKLYLGKTEENFSIEVKVMRNGRKMKISSEDVVQGDLVLLEAGRTVPVDVKLIEANQLRVFDAIVTGSTVTQYKTANLVNENTLESDVVLYPTQVVEGTGKGIVIGTGHSTAMYRETEGIDLDIPSPTVLLKNQLMNLTKSCLIWILVVGIIVFIVASTHPGHVEDDLAFFLTFVATMLPPGMMACICIVRQKTASYLFKHDCSVKNLRSVETVGAVTCICTDKTGTLTEDSLLIANIWLDNSFFSAGIPNNFEPGENPVTESPAWDALIRCLALNLKMEIVSIQTIDRKKYVPCGDPSEMVLYQMASQALGEEPKYYQPARPIVHEVPFTSETRYRVTINRLTSGDLAMFVKGAPEEILDRSSTILVDEVEHEMDDTWRAKVMHAFNDFGEQGERVFAFADAYIDQSVAAKFQENPDFFENDNDLIRNLRFLGLVSIRECERDHVSDAIETCRSRGMKVIMSTGDSPTTAEACARRVRIINGHHETADKFAARENLPLTSLDPLLYDSIVVTGPQLNQMTDQELDSILKFEEIVFARVTPVQKKRIVEGCQRSYSTVASIGDGLNDIPALRQAHVGIALGREMPDNIKHAADIVFLSKDFNKIIDILERSLTSADNMKKVICYNFCIDMVFLLPYLLYLIFGLPKMLSVEFILLLDFFTALSSLSLTVEPTEGKLLKRDPRQNQKLVNRQMIVRAYFQVGMIYFATYLSVFLWDLDRSGFPWSKFLTMLDVFGNRQINDVENIDGEEWTFRSRENLLLSSQTAICFSILIVQMVNLALTRTRKLSLFQHGTFSGPVYGAIAFQISFIVIMLFTRQPGVRSEMTTPNPLAVNAGVVFGLFLPVFEELKKLAIRHLHGSWFEDEYLW